MSNNNPLDVSNYLTNPDPKDVPAGPVKGIPGVISADAVTQSYVNLLAGQCQKENDYVTGIYNDAIRRWMDDNAKGIFHMAPGPMRLGIFNPKAAAAFLNGDASQYIIYTFYDSWNPAYPPGTLASPPPPPTVSTTLPLVGEHVPGTVDGIGGLYKALGNSLLDPSLFGEHDPSDSYELVLRTPFDPTPYWRRIK